MWKFNLKATVVLSADHFPARQLCSLSGPEDTLISQCFFLIEEQIDIVEHFCQRDKQDALGQRDKQDVLGSVSGLRLW